jgi:hypothetical protein
VCVTCLRAVIRRIHLQRPGVPSDPAADVPSRIPCRSTGADFDALFDDPPP